MTGPRPTGPVVGLDIGGSTTHAVLADATGTVLAESVVGSANVASVGVAEASRTLSVALGELGGADVEHVCAGAAGAGSPGRRARLAALIGELVPTARVRVVHDAQLVLSAAGLDTGIALISGTGSAAWGRTADGHCRRAGGWGYLLGDEGGGYGVAREAIRHVLARHDDGRAPDRLTRALLQRCGLTGADRLVELFYTNPERRHWARHAGLVFELAAQDDPAATRIAAAAAAALAGLVRTVATVLGTTGPVVCAGGLITHQPSLLHRLRADLAGPGPDPDDPAVTDVRLLDRAPVHGAVRLALAADAPPAGPPSRSTIVTSGQLTSQDPTLRSPSEGAFS